MSETATERLRNNAVKITSLLITGLWMGGLFLTNQDWWLGVLIVGYAAVLPIVKTLFGDDEEEYDDADEDGEWSHWWGREKKSGSSTDSDDEDDPLMAEFEEEDDAEPDDGPEEGKP